MAVDCNKEIYKTKHIATMAFVRLKAKAILSARGEMYPYFCKRCKGWHLSKFTREEYVKKFLSSKKKELEIIGKYK